MRTIEVVVKITMLEDADIGQVISDMDYEFTHPAIKDTEIVDVLYEG